MWSKLMYFVISLQIITFAYSSPLPPNQLQSSKMFKTRRSFDLHIDLWQNDLPLPTILEYEQHRDHITPDFSNGLEYPDPLLLLGPAAQHATRILYSRPLFFGDIKHVKLLMKNQQIRRLNGLSGNNLGSLRTHSPYYRFKKSLLLN